MNPLYDRALLQWPLTFAAATIFGTGAFALIVSGIEGCEGQSIADALLPAWRAMAVAVALLSPLMVLSVTAEMAETSWRAAIGLVPEVMAETHAGAVWRGYLPIAAILALAAFVPLRASARAAILSLLAAILLFLEALTSHAIDKGTAAAAVYFIHEAAAGAWIGALLTIWIVAYRAGPSQTWVAKAARAVSTTAAWSLGAIVLSGGFTAYQELGLDPYRLLFSTYGRTLMVKVVVFCGVLSIAAYNRERLIPEVSNTDVQKVFLRNVGLEALVLGTLVMALASLLANTPPAIGHMMHSHMAMTMQPRSAAGSMNSARFGQE